MGALTLGLLILLVVVGYVCVVCMGLFETIFGGGKYIRGK